LHAAGELYLDQVRSSSFPSRKRAAAAGQS